MCPSLLEKVACPPRLQHKLLNIMLTPSLRSLLIIIPSVSFIPFYLLGTFNPDRFNLFYYKNS